PRQRARPPVRARRVGAQVVVQQGAVQHRLEPHLHAADERAADRPPDALDAAVGHDLELQVGPQLRPPRRHRELGRHHRGRHGEERLVHHIHRRHRASVVTRPDGSRYCEVGFGKRSQCRPGGPTVREYSVPATYHVGDEENLLDAVYSNADEHGSAVVYRRQDAPGQWSDITCAQFAEQVVAVARGLVAAGVQPGDRVALLSRTRHEWTLADYAILAVGAATVPIYETSSAEQIRWILSDSEAVAAVVESGKHTALVDSVRAECPTVRHVWQIEPSDGGPGAVEALTALGAQTPAEEVRKRSAAVRADDLATLIYTSGTTGRPKGCELTHRNLLSEVKGTVGMLPELLSEQGSVLLFLPLAHVFGKVIQCGALYSRTAVGHTPDVKQLTADLASFRPTFILSAPRVFEKVYNSARQRAHDSGKGKVFDRAAEVAIAYS